MRNIDSPRSKRREGESISLGQGVCRIDPRYTQHENRKWWHLTDFCCRNNTQCNL